MSGGLVFVLVLGLIGLVGIGFGVGDWTRRIEPRGPIEPGSSAGRAYLYLPPSIAAFVASLLLGLDATMGPIPNLVAGPLLVITVTGFAVSPILAIWQPEWLRPRWQRQRIDRFRRRQDAIATGRGEGHHLLVLLTFGDDEEPVSTSADLAEARAKAEVALERYPDAACATVLDLDRGKIAATLERDGA